MSESNDSTKQSQPQWYSRCIGGFCGGLPGACLAAIFAFLLGDLSDFNFAMLLATGLATGILIGCVFPRAAEGLCWLLFHVN